MRTTALWAISTTNWNLVCFSPTFFARRQVREMSICSRNCSQGSCSYFDLPLGLNLLIIKVFDRAFLTIFKKSRLKLKKYDKLNQQKTTFSTTDIKVLAKPYLQNRISQTPYFIFSQPLNSDSIVWSPTIHSGKHGPWFASCKVA